MALHDMRAFHAVWAVQGLEASEKLHASFPSLRRQTPGTTCHSLACITSLRRLDGLEVKVLGPKALTCKS